MQGTSLALGECRAASSGVQTGAAAAEVAVGVLLYFHTGALKGLSRPACSLLGQAKVNAGAAGAPSAGAATQTCAGAAQSQSRGSCSGADLGLW